MDILPSGELRILFRVSDTEGEKSEMPSETKSEFQQLKDRVFCDLHRIFE
jgi:hypothetical protein